jgi:signal transduction histidine kinase
VRKLVAQAAANYMPPEGRDGLLLDLPAQAPWIRADFSKLEQALGNIISNAYKYSPRGGAVRIGLAPPGNDANEIGLRVVDRGMGMTPEQVARVCERFYRADSSGKIPGTGLGMSIVSEILALHGGRVEITSELGVGTEVTLWIPTAAPPVEGG